MKVDNLLAIALIMLVSCKSTADSRSPLLNNKLNKAWLDQYVTGSDSSYSRPYFRSDFVMASSYYNKKDSTVCQVMRDSSERVRQVIIARNNIRTFYAQFYANGQVIAIIGLNSSGQFDGEAINFFPDGNTMSKGRYSNGLYTGKWEYFNENEKRIAIEEYDTSGQLIKKEEF